MTDLGYRIRPVRALDIPALAAFDKFIFQDLAWSKQSLAHEIASPDTLYFLAEICTSGGEVEPASSIIGSVGAYVHTGPNPSADLHTIAVHPEYRNGGVGKSLLRTLVEHLSEKDIREVFLEVKVCNAPAIKFYLSMGFEKLSVRKGYYTKRKGNSVQSIDAYVMSANFNTLYKNLRR